MDNSFFDDENMKRLTIGIVSAVILHVIILLWFSANPSEKIISAETFSAPTNVTIRFLNPVKEQPKPIQKIVKTEPIKKKKPVTKTAKVIPPKTESKPQPEQFNKIEPAAFTPPKQVVAKEAVPVISERQLKGRRVQPEYPDRALRMKQEGVVWLRVLISETGARQEIKLHKPTKYALLNQAAIKAVKKWTFDPNIVNGRPTKSWVEIPIEFKIQ